MCSVLRIPEARQLEVFAAQRWKRRRTGPLCKLTPSLVVLLHPAAIHLVEIARCLMFDRGKVCLD